VVICLLLASAALLWPSRAFRHPQQVVPAARNRTAGGRPETIRTVLLAGGSVGAVALFGVIAGPAGLLAAAAVIGTAVLLIRRAVKDRLRRTALTDILAGLRMLARELRAGADPSVAAQNAGSAARGDGVVVLRALAELTRSDDRSARVPGAQTGGMRGALAANVPPVMQVSARLRSGWLLTRRYGVAFTPLIDALAADLAQQIAADSERSGEVAGPRMSGYVMALLPVLGLALGAGMGADPVRVLLTSALGNILMVAGISLTCAGLLWSDRIVRR
jgi:tight adherence protein B